MDNVIWISSVGAGLVILGLLLLWFLMDLLVRVTTPTIKKEKITDDSNSPTDEDNLEHKQKAAAASIAVGIALQNTSFLSPHLGLNQQMGVWQIAGRNRQLNNKLESPYRNRNRK